MICSFKLSFPPEVIKTFPFFFFLCPLTYPDIPLFPFACSHSDPLLLPKGENGVVQTTGQTPKREVTGIEAKLLGPSPDQASADNPVTLVFMGYKTVEEEQETRAALGMEGVDGNVKAEFVVIEDGEAKAGGEAATAEQAPPNGSMAEKESANVGGDNGDKEKEKKQTCKCCTVM